MSGGDELKKLRMAVCETEELYREYLVDYISRQEGEHFEVFGFAGEEEYQREEEKKPFDILLFGADFFKKAKGISSKGSCFYLSGETIPPEYEQEKALFKYQAADQMMREIHSQLGIPSVQEEEKRMFSGKKEVITVYSPWNHRMQTPFVLAAAEELAGQGRRKVLYLNFSVCGGFCRSAGIEKGMDMGDLFYLLREGEKEFLAKMRSSIYMLGNFFVIPPPENPGHYIEWKAEEMETFLELLVEKTEYEVFLLDITHFIPGFFEVLEKSSRIWILKEHRYRDDPGLEELRRLLERRKSGLERRAQEVFLPKDQPWREDGRYQVEEFYMSELGRCAKKLLEKRDEIGCRTDPKEYLRGDGSE